MAFGNILNKTLAVMLAIIFTLVGITMVTSVAQNTIPQAATSYYNLANSYNSTVVGTGANTIATSTPSWLGYLWVVLPFALVALLIVKAFKAN